MDIKDLTIFALIGSFAAFFNQFKAGFYKVFSFFVRTDEVEYFEVARVLATDLISECKVIRWGNKKYNPHFCFMKPFDIWSFALFLSNGSLLCIYRGKIPIIISESAFGIKITYLFKTFRLESHLEKAFLKVVSCKVDESENLGNFYVSEISGSISSDGSGASSLSPPDENSKLSNSNVRETSGILRAHSVLKDKAEIVGLKYSDLIEDAKQKKLDFYWSDEGLELEKEVEFWVNSEKWYNDRRVPFRRSALLHGEPGCGKSKLVLEIAKKLKLPLYKINISNMSDTEFADAFSSSPKGIVLLEDVDTIFHGRENILAGKSISKQLMSFDTLLNTLSGVKQKNGCFIICSTNYTEKLDPAFLRRLDVHIEVKRLDQAGRRFIAENILCDWPDLMEQIIIEGDGDTASNYENRCVEVAVKKYYETNR